MGIAGEPENPRVSVKAALRCGDKWILLRNDRNEWELPGGQVDVSDATFRDVLVRECREELGVEVQVGELLDCYLFEVVPNRRVTIVCFSATVDPAAAEQLVISDEHEAVGLFSTAELDNLVLPAGYRNAISLAIDRHSPDS